MLGLLKQPVRLIDDPSPVADAPPCPVGSRSGRTQWMIDRLVDAVREGQPACVVVGHSWEFVEGQLRQRVCDSLQAAGMVVTTQPWTDEIVCEGTSITFAIPSDMRKQIHAAEFWDHCAVTGPI